MVYEIAVVVGGEEGMLIEAIEHEGKLWLVPMWIEDKLNKQRKPARMVFADIVKPARRLPNDTCDGYVAQTIPRSVLFGQPSPQEAAPYKILDDPDLQPISVQ